MLATRWLLSVTAAAACASANLLDSLPLPGILSRDDLSLLKRENLSVGSPLYNCHDNCGMAIEEIQNCGSVCNDTTFITDYDNCLQCSGPDNEDIWKYYGPELNSTAAACGFSTTPENGTQASVDAAITASNSTAACEAAQEASSTSTATSSSASSTSTSSSGAVPTAAANSAAFGAVAVAALFAIGI